MDSIDEFSFHDRIHDFIHVACDVIDVANVDKWVDWNHENRGPGLHFFLRIVDPVHNYKT